MKTFTVKDFVTYNSPCFACGQLIDFQIKATPNDTFQEISIKPIVQKSFILVNLHLGWDSDLKLTVEHKTNKFAVNNMPRLTKYLQKHMLSLNCQCNTCFSGMKSNFLHFNLEKGFIKPVTIDYETIIVFDKKHKYTIYSNYVVDRTSIFVDDNSMATPPLQINTSLIPRYKFANKEKLINKIKLLILFS